MRECLQTTAQLWFAVFCVMKWARPCSSCFQEGAIMVHDTTYTSEALHLNRVGVITTNPTVSSRVLAAGTLIVMASCYCYALYLYF